MTSRPNILLITSDQQRADCFGFENRHIKTPHIDALATQGTRFAACVTPNLVCQPSRASILTGLLPLSTVCGTTVLISTPRWGRRVLLAPGGARLQYGVHWEGAFLHEIDFPANWHARVPIQRDKIRTRLAWPVHGFSARRTGGVRPSAPHTPA